MVDLVDKLLTPVQLFLQAHGWTLVGLALIVYLLKPKFDDYVYKVKHQRALAQANDPERVRILNVERERVRREQQARAAEAAAATPPPAAAGPTSRSRRDLENQRPRPSAGGHNPLDGHSSGSSYKRPVKKTRGG